MSNPSPAAPIRLHRHPLSGHAHRVELFLALLGLPYEMVDVDLFQGEQRTPAFLALNPFGEVPVIQDGEATIADSNAILTYLALRYDDGRWLPRAPLAMAAVQRWLSVAAGPLASGPARARVNRLFGGGPVDPGPVEITAKLFAQMNAHLATTPFLAAATPTIADVALYSYTAHAPEGGIALEPYPNVTAWIARVEALPGFVGMVRS